jgi:hypothetical protein
MNVNEILEQVERIRKTLKEKSDFAINPINRSLPVIPPYIGGGNIKLIVLGQDPTVKNVSSRSKISCALNLNKAGALRTYIEEICRGLSISIENVYATNLFKYFYSAPPAKTFNVLKAHLPMNLELLKGELNALGNIPIISLGEPVLQLLSDDFNKVRTYWGYCKSGSSNGNFYYSIASVNKLGLDFFPFPHQPSRRKVFYANTIGEYLKYMNMVCGIQYPTDAVKV